MTPADVRLAFPQFKDVGDPAITAAIAAAAPFFNEPSRYGQYLEQAQLHCVAHFVLFKLPDQGLDKGANDATSETRPTLAFSRDPSLLQRQAVDPFMRTWAGQMYAFYRGQAGLGGAAAVLSPAACVALSECG